MIKTLRSDVVSFSYSQPEPQLIELSFDAPKGTSHHTYLIKSIQKNILIDLVPAQHFDSFMADLHHQLSPSNLDYIVLLQANPAMVSSLQRLLIFAPQIKLACSANSHKFLKQMGFEALQAQILNSGDIFDLGDKELRFLTAPFVYWPDALMAFCPQEGYLFSGALFSTHQADTSESVPTSAQCLEHQRFFEHFLAPYKSHLKRSYKKIRDLGLNALLPAHGPLWTSALEPLWEAYDLWLAEEEKAAPKTCLVAYASAYGSTAALASHIAKGIDSAGNIEVMLTDIAHTSPRDLLQQLDSADGFLLGSPTIHADAPSLLWTFLGQLNPIRHGRKQAAAFGSYGWSGEAAEHISKRLEQLKMQVSKSFTCHFTPNEDTLMDAYQFGLSFGSRLLATEEVTIEPVLPRAQIDRPLSSVKKSWRCIICGEVFEGTEPPEVCPACGANYIQFEALEEETPNISAVSGAAIVIIGNNAAGTAACEAIRKRSEDASIILISEENELGYYRPMLSDYMSASHNEAKFYLHPNQWYAERYIDLRLGTKIIEVRPHQKCLLTETNEMIYYDKLILATGAKNTTPTMADTHLKGIFSLRTLKDADAIVDYAKTAKHVFVIGGGVLGLETAWELKNLGLEVTVLEVMDRLLPRQLDIEASRRFEKVVQNCGIDVIKGTKVVAMLGDDVVEGVQLLDGRIVETDMVIISVGISPNRQLAETAGLHHRVGIIVDANMQTNMKDIYACGDVAEFEGRVYGLWAVATDQGRVAGANAVGDDIRYTPSEPATVFNGMGESIFSIGDVAAFENKGFESVTDISATTGNYKKLYFDTQGVFVGGILMGDVKHSLQLIRALPKRMPKEQLLPLIFN